MARLEKMLALQPAEPSDEGKRPKIQLNVAIFRDRIREDASDDS